MGAQKAFFVPSARVGLFLILRALELPPGSRILVPAFTHPSMPLAILAAGHQPVPVDTRPGVYTPLFGEVSPGAWEGARVVLATHLYGLPCDPRPWAEETRRRGVTIIEDCAQGLGVLLGGRPAGSFGAASLFSFSLTKNFVTLGGGMVAASDPDLAARLRSLRTETVREASRATLIRPLVMAAAMKVASHPLVFAGLVGWIRSGERRGRDPLHEAFREEALAVAPPPEETLRRAPCGVQAALGRRLLARLEEDCRRREETGRGLLEALERRLGRDAPLVLPSWPQDARPVFLSFVCCHPRPHLLAVELRRRGVDTAPGYLQSCVHLPAVRKRLEDPDGCPGASQVEAQQIHLPCYPALTPRDTERIAAAVEASGVALGACADSG